jgi:hypothetical protein
VGAIAFLGIFLRGCGGGAALVAAVLCCGPSRSVADNPAPTRSALNIAPTQVETVSFADPRWPAVRVVRGAQLTAATAVIRPPPVPSPVAAAAPTVFRATYS